MRFQWFNGIQIPAPPEVFPLKIITPEEWGALPAKEYKKTGKQYKTIVFAFNTEMSTCTTAEDCKKAVQDLQKRHLDLGYPDICYNFAIGGDGNIYEGRGWRGSHTTFYPARYGRPLVVGIIGKGQDGDEWIPPFDRAIRKLTIQGQDLKRLPKEHKIYIDRMPLFPFGYVRYVRKFYKERQYAQETPFIARNNKLKEMLEWRMKEY